MVWVPGGSYVMCLLSVGYISPLLNLTIPAIQSFSSLCRCLVSRCLLFSPGPDWAPCLKCCCRPGAPFPAPRAQLGPGGGTRLHAPGLCLPLPPLRLQHSQKAQHCEPRAGRVADPDSIGSVDPDPGGQKWPTKVEIFFKSSCFEVLDGLFWELKASPVTWTFFMEA